MNFYNETGSVVNMAQQTLRDLDPSSVETRISTAQLELMLKTLIKLGQPETAQQVSTAGARSIETIKASIANIRQGA